MIKPTGRLLVLVAVATPVVALAIIASDELWVIGVVYLGSIMLLAITDERMALQAQELSVQFSLPGHIYVGDVATVAADVASQESGRPWLEALLHVGPIVTPPDLQRARFNGDALRLSFELRPTQRGEAELIEFWLRWPGPMGLTWHHLVVPLGRRIPVISNLGALHRAALDFKRLGIAPGVKPQAVQGDGSEFDALREYAPGFNVRSIDWKQSARHRRLLCKEFHAERNHQVILAVDSGRLMREPLNGTPKLDHAINACLVLALQALLHGDRVGVFVFDSLVRRFQPVMSGTRSFHRLQQSLATIDYSLEETNFTLGLSTLSAKLQRRALVVLITDFVDTVTAQLMVENLQRMAARHVVLFATLRDPAVSRIALAMPQSLDSVARSVAAAELGSERRKVLQRLRALGVNAVDTEPHHLDAALLNNYLRIKQRELI